MKRSSALVGALLLIAVLGALDLFVWFADFWLPVESRAALTIQDRVGSAGALFSALAFAAVLYAVWLQQQELELQRQELAETREDENCECCGNVPGATKSFLDFMERFGPTGLTRTQVRDLYKLRSCLTHGRTVLQMDAKPIGPPTGGEDGQVRLLRLCVQAAAVRWLLHRADRAQAAAARS